LWLREAVLKNAGFNVATITDERQALARIDSVDCGLLLLTHKYREACRVLAQPEMEKQRSPLV
jgi:hypothetical protein